MGQFWPLPESDLFEHPLFPSFLKLSRVSSRGLCFVVQFFCGPHRRRCGTFQTTLSSLAKCTSTFKALPHTATLRPDTLSRSQQFSSASLQVVL